MKKTIWNGFEGVVGYILFIIGLGTLTNEAIKYYGTPDGIPFLLLLCLLGILGYGLELIITDQVNKAKVEMRKELEEKLDEIRG